MICDLCGLQTHYPERINALHDIKLTVCFPCYQKQEVWSCGNCRRTLNKEFIRYPVIDMVHDLSRVVCERCEPICNSWIGRERHRIYSGVYKRIPWNIELPPHHFPHCSELDKSKLAFTPSDKHGRADRQTQIKPGKYLRKYTSYPDHIIEELQADWKATFCRVLAITNDEREMMLVYKGGPNSCMSAGHGFDENNWPTAVYCAGDLSIAYFGSIDNAIARTIVWPDKQIYSRKIYGDRSTLISLLDDKGYSGMPHRDPIWQGAKLLRREYGNKFLMPYLDIGPGVIDCGDHFRIGNDDDIDYSCFGLDGSIPNGSCECCGNSYLDIVRRCNDDQNLWCDKCIESGGEGNECANCYERVSDDDSMYYDGEYYCSDCHDELTVYCERCEEYRSRDDSQRVGDYIWCDDCVSYHSWNCEGCAEHFPIEENHTEYEGELYCNDCAPDYIPDDDDDEGEE